ncbi:FAD-dependent oxidoreductase [Staphylococcus gallinarum]|uniref:FAD-dependent oxidoreductase n=1 Tax=Staphylococcus gallinarum TaxID=1293 RepID=A0A418HNK4_STAGA|nr:NAD(P)/FAD-dependent oxidoreductase [Staphylococcus gallinarum]RIL42644.1 FAD-dependent oxidoreductase [Staphylococcus gallinarum]RIO89304.1 FAD-dependent oxidoreductase [Staphylococcus gallinarum]
MKDVVIIGGGLAGLSSAWRLKHQDILLLETENRVGGRINSERRGDYWLNWGGHLFAGPESATDELIKSVGITALPVPGKLTGMYLNGKLLLNGLVELYPFMAPMSWKARMAMMWKGAKVRAAVIKYGKVAKKRPNEDYSEQQQRVLEFMENRTFSDFTGQLPPEADAIFRPTVSRSTGTPETMTAGSGIGYFHTVWNKDQGLGRNILGGPSTLTDTIGKILKDQIQLNASVENIQQFDNHVKIIYNVNGKKYEVDSRFVVIATPPSITRNIVENLDEEMDKALSEIKYGPHVSAAFLTNEKGKQIWDNIYSIATPKKSFDIVLHQSNLVHDKKIKRNPGSSFMTFSPGESGRKLFDKSDKEIIDIYLNDLNDIFPNFKEYVVEAHVKKYPFGSAYVHPGRSKLQPILTQPFGRIYLAGDYLGTNYTETAIQTGFTAAQNINSFLVTKKENK